MHSGMHVKKFTGSRSGRRDLGSKFPQGPAGFFMKMPMTVPFRPDPPVRVWKPQPKKKKTAKSRMTGVAAAAVKFETSTPPVRVVDETPKVRRALLLLPLYNGAARFCSLTPTHFNSTHPLLPHRSGELGSRRRRRRSTMCC